KSSRQRSIRCLRRAASPGRAAAARTSAYSTTCLAMANSAFGGTATPLPSSPARGEVPPGTDGAILPHLRCSTLPLAGRAGEGVARDRKLRVFVLVRPYGTAAAP